MAGIRELYAILGLRNKQQRQDIGNIYFKTKTHSSYIFGCYIWDSLWNCIFKVVALYSVFSAKRQRRNLGFVVTSNLSLDSNYTLA